MPIWDSYDDDYRTINVGEHNGFEKLQREAIEKEMKEAAPFLRGKLAKVLEVRNIPELQFIYDETIEYATKIERVITNINKD